MLLFGVQKNIDPFVSSRRITQKNLNPILSETPLKLGVKYLKIHPTQAVRNGVHCIVGKIRPAEKKVANKKSFTRSYG